MTDKLKELATVAARCKWTQPWSETISNDQAAYIAAASPDVVLALISDLENERRKVTELVDGYEKDQAELKRLRGTIFTDNTQTVVNAEREIERLKGEQAVLISLFREGLDVIETLVGESTDEQENLDALTERMNNAINDVEYRHT